MKKYLLAMLLLSLSLTGPLAVGAEKVNGPQKAASQRLSVPPIIAKMLQRGRDISIVDSFPVADTGLVGWVLAAAGENRIYYVTPDQQHVIYGLLFDRDLSNMTSGQIKSYPATQVARLKPVSDGSAARSPIELERGARVGEALDAARASKEIFIEGAGKDVYVVFDPGCKYCHRLWLRTRSLPPGVRIHWIPVATATKAGASLAQAIVEFPNRSEAMQRAAILSLDPAMRVSAAVTADLQQNAAILEVIGKRKVPLILFQDAGSPAAFLGVPEASQISRIFGPATSVNGQH
jgi:protein-disulfide isomerase